MRIAKLLDADRHGVVPGRGLRAVGAEQAVPPRQIESEIAVGLARRYRMMHPMHVRRHDEPAQHAVQHLRDADITVVEHRGRVEQHFEDQHCKRGRAERGDHRELDHHRQQDLEGMKAQPGGHVEFEVGVMHAMQPPQRRHGVKEDMLEIDRKVEKDDRGNDRDPGRKRDCIEEAPGMRLGNECEAHGRRRKHEADEKRVHDHHAEIAGPAHTAANGLSAAGTEQLPGRHHGEDSAESAQPDQRLASQYGIAHGHQYPVLTTA
jgi:hypothetical protein